MRIAKLYQMQELETLDGQIDGLDLSEFHDLTNDNLKKIINHFPNLRVLDLSDTKISDLSALANMSQLEELDISGTEVADLLALLGLANLKRIYAYDTVIDDLLPLQNLPLIILEIGRAAIADLTPLNQIKTLEEINLQGNKNVMYISALSKLTNLVKLDLTGTSVTYPNELAHLEPLPQLKKLYVNVDIEFAAKAVLQCIEKNRQQQRIIPSIFQDINSKESNIKDIQKIIDSESFVFH